MAVMPVTLAEHRGQAWRVTGKRAHQRSVKDVPEEKSGDEGKRKVGHPGANRVRGENVTLTLVHTGYQV